MKVHACISTIWLVLAGSLAPAQEQVEARSYDVSAIVAPLPDSEVLIAPQGNLVLSSLRYAWPAPPDMPFFGNDRGARTARKEDAPALNEEPAARQAQLIQSRGEELVELVRQQLYLAGLAAEEDAGGTTQLRYHSGLLLIQGPAPVQEGVQRVLAPLQERARRLIHVRCLLVPQEILDEIEPRWREAGPILPPAVFQKALLDARSRLLSAVARSGQKLTTGSKDLRAFIVDQEINQTGVIPVSNPVVDVPFAGDRLQVRPFFLGEKDLLLDLAVGRFRVSAARSKLGSEWSDLDLPVTDEALLSTTFRLRTGEACVAGSLGGEGGTAVLVEADALGAVRASQAPPATEERSLRTFEVRPLLRSNEGRRWWEERRPWRAMDQDPNRLFEVLSGLVGGLEALGTENILADHQGLVFLYGPREMQDKVGKHLQAELARATELAAVDLDLLEVPREILQRLAGETEDGFLLKAGWRSVLEGVGSGRRTSYSLVGIAGEEHALRLAKIRSVVTDVESVSGGTGFAIVERADPVVQACGQGVELRLQVDFPPGADGARLFLEGADARDLEVHDVRARFPSVSEVLTGQAAQEPGSQPGPVGKGIDIIKEIQLNLPEQKVSFWDLEREIPLDRDVILQADAPEGGEARLLVARVRKLR